jgi:hypothetical protein
VYQVVLENARKNGGKSELSTLLVKSFAVIDHLALLQQWRFCSSISSELSIVIIIVVVYEPMKLASC